jgi:hypothetical protein
MKPKKRRRFSFIDPLASSNHCSASLDQNRRSSTSKESAAKQPDKTPKTPKAPKSGGTKGGKAHTTVDALPVDDLVTSLLNKLAGMLTDKREDALAAVAKLVDGLKLQALL